MSPKTMIVLLCFGAAVVLAIVAASVAASVPAVHPRLLALAVGATALGLAIEAS